MALVLTQKGVFLHADGTYGVHLIIFGADLSSSTHANNRANNILVLGKDFIQGINGPTIYAEKIYIPNFTVYGKKVCLSLHYNVMIIICLSMVDKLLSLKQNSLKLCLKFS